MWGKKRRKAEDKSQRPSACSIPSVSHNRSDIFCCFSHFIPQRLCCLCVPATICFPTHISEMILLHEMKQEEDRLGSSYEGQGGERDVSEKDKSDVLRRWEGVTLSTVSTTSHSSVFWAQIYLLSSLQNPSSYGFLKACTDMNINAWPPKSSSSDVWDLKKETASF